jgi:hypothetical protein
MRLKNSFCGVFTARNISLAVRGEKRGEQKSSPQHTEWEYMETRLFHVKHFFFCSKDCFT